MKFKEPKFKKKVSWFELLYDKFKSAFWISYHLSDWHVKIENMSLLKVW